MKLDNKTILFQGDSITDMLRGRDYNDHNHLYGHSYVFLLAGKFGYETPEKHIKVHNRGNSGDRCIDVYARWQEDAIALKPDIISLLVGINDIMVGGEDGNPISAEEYTEVLSRIIEETKKELPDVRFVLCEPFAFPQSTRDGHNEKFSVNVPLHQKALQSVAEKYGCIFVPLQEDFEAAYQAHPDLGRAYWIWDGVHPTAAGQQIIAWKWLECVNAAEEDGGCEQ